MVRCIVWFLNQHWRGPYQKTYLSVSVVRWAPSRHISGFDLTLRGGSSEVISGQTFQNKLNFVIFEIIRVFKARTFYSWPFVGSRRTTVRIWASPYRPESIEIKKVSFTRSFMCVHESNLRFIWFGRLHYYALRCKPSPGSCDPESRVKWGQPGSDDFGIMTILVRIIWDWGLLLIGLIKPSIYSPCNPGSSSHNRIIPLIITHKYFPYLQSYLQWPYWVGSSGQDRT